MNLARAIKDELESKLKRKLTYSENKICESLAEKKLEEIFNQVKANDIPKLVRDIRW